LVHALVLLLHFSLHSSEFSRALVEDLHHDVVQMAGSHEVDLLVHDFVGVEEILTLLLGLADLLLEQFYELFVRLDLLLDEGLGDFG